MCQLVAGARFAQDPNIEKWVLVDMVWTTRTHESSDHKWFRQLVANSVGT